jgi:hypothetical protein
MDSGLAAARRSGMTAPCDKARLVRAWPAAYCPRKTGGALGARRNSPERRFPEAVA